MTDTIEMSSASGSAASGASAARPHDATQVDPAALAEVLFARWGEARKHSRELLKRDEFHYIPGATMAEHRERTSGQLKRLVEEGVVHRAFPKSLGGEEDHGGNIASFEELVIGDPSMQIKSGVQWGLFGAAVMHLGTQRAHEQFLPGIMSLATPGAFAMTESGHGSDVASIGTTATFDPDTDEFVIDTPFRNAWKDYLGNAAKDGQAAVVFAQLIVSGVNHGVHAFYVPIRDGEDFLPGIGGEDDGLKGGLNGIDNGRLHFHGVRVPRTNLLNRYGDVDENGVYSSPIASPGRRFFTMVGTLVQGRVSLDGAATVASKLALTIAVRYAAERRQFADGEGADEVVLLDYQRHQRRLLPRLAQTYAMSFAHDQLLEKFHGVFSGEKPSPPRSSRSAPGRLSIPSRRLARRAAATASSPRTVSRSCAPTSTSTRPSRATTTSSCSSSPSVCSRITRAVSPSRMPQPSPATPASRPGPP
jgi:acyl-CoA oxidase